MIESYLKQSPLAHLGLAGRARQDRGEAGVAMSERPFRGIVNLRGDPAEIGPAFEAAFDAPLPTAPNSVGQSDAGTAIWLGPDEWWIVVPDPDGAPDPEAGAATAARLRGALEDCFHAVTDVSESRTCIRVSGPRARDLLQKGCSLDFHPRVFVPGTCAQSQLAKATVVLHLLDGAEADEHVFEVYILRSFAEYLWRWLEDAAREYGLAIVER